jgi:ATP-dependent Clp protease ATP-binding subunit ClpB
MLAERNVTIMLDNSAKELLMREGYDPSYGARPLKRAIQSLIQNPLAVKLLQGEIQPGQTVWVTANGDQMQFSTSLQDGENLSENEHVTTVESIA